MTRQRLDRLWRSAWDRRAAYVAASERARRAFAEWNRQRTLDGREDNMAWGQYEQLSNEALRRRAEMERSEAAYKTAEMALTKSQDTDAPAADNNETKRARDRNAV